MSFQGKEVVMLLDNAFAPDLRVHKEAVCLKEFDCSVTIFAWDRDCKYPITDEKDGINIKRIRTKSKYQLGLRQLLFLTLFYLKTIPSLLRNTLIVVLLLKSVEIPNVLIYGLHLNLSTSDVNRFHSIRDTRNKIAHGESLHLDIRYVMNSNKFLRELAVRIDRHIVDNFFVIEKFT